MRRRIMVGVIFWLLVLAVIFSLAFVVGVLINGLILGPFVTVPVTQVETAWSDIPEPRVLIPEPVVERKPRTVSRGTVVSRIFYSEVTAYCACERCCGKAPGSKYYGITASGTLATEGRTVAADWSRYPAGTKLRIEGFGDRVFVVEDRGGGIKGSRIDIFFDSHTEALRFGRRRGVRVEVLD